MLFKLRLIKQTRKQRKKQTKQQKNYIKYFLGAGSLWSSQQPHIDPLK